MENVEVASSFSNPIPSGKPRKVDLIQTLVSKDDGIYRVSGGHILFQASVNQFHFFTQWCDIYTDCNFSGFCDVISVCGKRNFVFVASGVGRNKASETRLRSVILYVTGSIILPALTACIAFPLTSASVIWAKAVCVIANRNIIDKVTLYVIIFYVI